MFTEKKYGLLATTKNTPFSSFVTPQIPRPLYLNVNSLPLPEAVIFRTILIFWPVRKRHNKTRIRGGDVFFHHSLVKKE